MHDPGGGVAGVGQGADLDPVGLRGRRHGRPLSQGCAVRRPVEAALAVVRAVDGVAGGPVVPAGVVDAVDDADVGVEAVLHVALGGPEREIGFLTYLEKVLQ